MTDSNKILSGIAVIVVVVLAGFLIFSGGDDATEDSSSENEQTSTSQSESPDDGTQAEVEESTIVELAQATDSLSTLVSAVVEADLVGTLNGEGPFTVFAPTNDAFGDLLEALDVSAEELLAREDLADILTYHVVAGKVMAADLSDGQVVKTVNGGDLTVSISDDGKVTLTDANDGKAMVVTADVSASNGVVHIIDAVVLP